MTAASDSANATTRGLRQAVRVGVLVVPGVIVGYLRAGLQWRLGHAAEDIALLSIRPREHTRRASYDPALNQHDSSRALLNVIGWDAQPIRPDVRVNLYRHGRVLVDALRLFIEIETNFRDARAKAAGIDPDMTFGLHFWLGCVDEDIATLEAMPAPVAMAGLIAAEVEVAARAGCSANRERLQRELCDGAGRLVTALRGLRAVET